MSSNRNTLCFGKSMYVQSSHSFMHASYEEVVPSAPKSKHEQSSSQESLEHFSEKAVLTFEGMNSGLDTESKNEIIHTLNSIGKAAAFASVNGYMSQSERQVVNQYFENFEGVLSDDQIKKMIFTKLDNPNFKHRDFLERFAQALDEPLAHIDIRI